MPREAQKTIYQIKISLTGSDPLIWRRVLVKRTINFEDLHFVIQMAMGWTNSHLHQFVVGRTHIYDMEFELEQFGDQIHRDEQEVKLALKEDELPFDILYEYDLGDSWMHDIVIEKMLHADTSLKYPHCVEGEMKCPPEDCGGLGAFYDMLKVLKGRRGAERKRYMEWLGGGFDPKEFDVDAVNRTLRRIALWKRWAREGRG